MFLFDVSCVHAALSLFSLLSCALLVYVFVHRHLQSEHTSCSQVFHNLLPPVTTSLMYCVCVYVCVCVCVCVCCVHRQRDIPTSCIVGDITTGAGDQATHRNDDNTERSHDRLQII